MAPLLAMQDIRQELPRRRGAPRRRPRLRGRRGPRRHRRERRRQVDLMKVLAGVHSPDEGTIEIDGRAGRVLATRSRRRARAWRSSSRSSTSCRSAPSRRTSSSAASRPGAAWSTSARWSGARASCSSEVGVDRTSARGRWSASLSTAQQQIVEIVKALSLDARILVMDEPTAALAEHEVEVLFSLLRRLRERGLGVLYISHRLREIFRSATGSPSSRTASSWRTVAHRRGPPRTRWSR